MGNGGQKRTVWLARAHPCRPCKGACHASWLGATVAVVGGGVAREACDVSRPVAVAAADEGQ